MSDNLQYRVAAVRRRDAAMAAARALCRWLAAVAAALCAAFLADWLLVGRAFDEPPGDRGAQGVLVLATAAALAEALRRTVWRAVRRRRDDDDIALALERRYGALGGGLIAVLQLRRAQSAGRLAGSAELLDAAEEQTACRSRDLAFGAVVDHRGLALSAGAMLAVLLAAGALAAWQSQRVGVFARRMLLAREAYPTATRIVGVEAAAKVPAGEALAVTAAVDPAGRVPDSAALEVRPAADGQRARVPMARVDEPSRLGASPLFRAELAGVVEDLLIRVAAGDARSPWRRVTVVHRPAVTAVELTYHYPAYTHRPVEKADGGDIRAVVGTRVAVSARASKPLRRARLVVLSGEAETSGHDLAVGDGGRVVRGEIDVRDSGAWRLRLTDEDGFEDSPPAQWVIEALPDRPPTVAVRFPAEDRVVTPSARWPVIFEARDDFGLGEVRLKYRLGGAFGAGQSETMDRPMGRLDANQPGPRRQAVAQAVVDLAALGAQPGRQIHYWLEVADNHSPAPQTARSKTFTFDVADPKTVGDALNGERDAALRQLGLIVQEEESSRAMVDQARQLLRAGAATTGPAGKE